jgi:hypothetical protein
MHDARDARANAELRSPRTHLGVDLGGIWSRRVESSVLGWIAVELW